MGLFTKIFGTESEHAISRAVEKVVEKKLRDTISALSQVDSLNDSVRALKKERETLHEDLAREKLDIQHKLGLERLRQEQETKMAKKELEAQREQLVAERELATSIARFEGKEEAMKETREVMREFQDRQENMIESLLKALPSAEIWHSTGS